jgi:YHS domain-containing protein
MMNTILGLAAGLLVGAAAGDDGPVNANCPVSGRPVDPAAPTVQHKGNTVGLCCPRCEDRFKAWPDDRKEQFIAEAMGQPPHGHGGEDRPDSGRAPFPELYTLGTCPVSGMDLGSMGDPVVRRYDGREVRFCCAGCIDAFERDKDTHWKKIDERIVKEQLPHYPLTTCPVSGEDLGDGAVNHIHNNRLIRFCCPDCVGRFVQDPAPALKKLDEAIKQKQRPDYPVTTCLVGRAPLGSMGEPTEIIAGNMLIRFCCAGCEPGFRANPHKFLTQLRTAWRRQEDR